MRRIDKDRKGAALEESFQEQRVKKLIKKYEKKQTLLFTIQTILIILFFISLIRETMYTIELKNQLDKLKDLLIRFS